MKDHPAVKEVYALIGRIATTWSEVELYWYLIFTTLLPNTERSVVDAIYFQWDTFAKQREMVLGAALAAYPLTKAGHKHPKYRRLGQLQAKTNDAAGNRNAAVHAMLNIPVSGAHLLYQEEDFIIRKSPNPRKPNKLAGKAPLRKELLAIVAEVDDLRDELRSYLDEVSPKFEAPPDMIAALRRLGFQVPPWIVERPANRADPKASS
jgi:hypothetical protein